MHRHPCPVRPRPRPTRRQALIALAAGPWLPGWAAPAGESADTWSLVQDGRVVLFRHASAPGTGDPPGFRLDDCSTQRNLDAAGRDQARRLGERFRQRNIAVGAVWSSRWCRARDTAELAFPARARQDERFDSFFGDPTSEPARTRAARAALLAWRGPGVLVVFTHQVNITALTGLVPASGEGVLLQPGVDGLQVVGRLTP